MRQSQARAERAEPPSPSAHVAPASLSPCWGGGEQPPARPQDEAGCSASVLQTGVLDTGVGEAAPVLRRPLLQQSRGRRQEGRRGGLSCRSAWAQG